MRKVLMAVLAALGALLSPQPVTAQATAPVGASQAYQVAEDAQFIRIATPELAAGICKKGYVSGVASGSLLDKKTGFHDPGFGLDIVDWIMEPAMVWEAWCHQRGYVCMIEEFGGRPIRPGQSFSAAFLVGYFDTLDEANRAFDAHKGHTALEVSANGWKLTK